MNNTYVPDWYANMPIISAGPTLGLSVVFLWVSWQLLKVARLDAQLRRRRQADRKVSR